MKENLTVLENAIENNCDVSNSYIEDITAVAKASARGQELVHELGGCSVLIRLLQAVNDKFKVEEADKTVFSPGDAVHTVWGDGRVQGYRAKDDMYVVVLDHWKLAQGQSPTLYLGGSSMKKSAAVFHPGDAVCTAWGNGKVHRYRAVDDIYLVLLDHWKLAQGQSPTLYLNASALTDPNEAVGFSVGDLVGTVWGNGCISDYREDDNMYIVHLEKWKLAQGQSPTLYLGVSSLKKRDLEYERKLAEVKAAHDDALSKIAALLTAIGTVMRRSLPKPNSCKPAIRSFIDLGFIDLVVECLNKFMHCPDAVNAASWCIMVMCSDNPDNQVSLARAGACDGIMQALSTHAGNEDIIEYICRAARNLASNLSIAHYFVGSGIGELIACVVILHINRPEQCEAGLWVVTNLSCDMNNATVLGGIGMCDAITNVLRTYVNNASMSAAATWTLKNLACGSKFNYSQLIHTDVCDSLLAILKNFLTDPNVMSPALWALANITCDPALSVKINESDEICDLVVMILNDYMSRTKAGLVNNSDDVEENLDIVEASMWALRNIASAGATNKSINDVVCERIHEVLTTEYFLTDESLVDSSVAAIVNILSNISPKNDTFRDKLQSLGFAQIFRELLSKHKVESIMCHASKAICLYAKGHDTHRIELVEIGTCQRAVSMMHTFKENENVVKAVCEILYALYYCQSPAHASRLLDQGMVKEGEDGKIEICSKPFNEIKAAWLPDEVAVANEWIVKS